MNTGNRKLYRSRTNRMIFGVCAGLAEFFGIDPTVVRLVFVAGALLGFGSFVLIYLVMFFVVPEEPIA
jgi:phage shock protein C